MDLSWMGGNRWQTNAIFIISNKLLAVASVCKLYDFKAVRFLMNDEPDEGCNMVWV